MTPQPAQPRHAIDEIRHRVHELRAVRTALLPDADDPRTLSELTHIDVELVAAERNLSAAITTRARPTA